MSLQESTLAIAHVRTAARVKSVMGTSSRRKSGTQQILCTKAHKLKENARLPSTATCSLIHLACSMQNAHTSITAKEKAQRIYTNQQLNRKTHRIYLLPGLHGLWRREIDQGSCFDGAALNVLNLITGCGCNYIHHYTAARMGVQQKGC